MSFFFFYKDDCVVQYSVEARENKIIDLVEATVMSFE